MRHALLLPLFLALVLPATRLAAEEATESPSEAATLVTQIEELRKAKDEGELRSAVAKVPDLFNAATDAAVKASLADALGKVAKDKKVGEARPAAVEAIGQLNDKKIAWKELKGLIPDPKVEEPDALDLAVVKTAGIVADEGAIEPLKLLTEKAKATPLAREAAMALGGFTAASKKKKVDILDSLLGLAVRIKPSSGGSSNKAASPEAQERFQQVGGAIVGTANALTARKIGTWEEWEVLYKENKKNLGKLLPEE